MEHFHNQVVDADPLSRLEQIFWRYLTRHISEFDGSTKEFQIQSVEAYQSAYGHVPENLSAAARAISDILESLRTKGMWANLNGSDLTRLGYISGSTIFSKRPGIVVFTIDDRLRQLICPKQ